MRYNSSAEGLKIYFRILTTISYYMMGLCELVTLFEN